MKDVKLSFSTCATKGESCAHIISYIPRILKTQNNDPLFDFCNNKSIVYVGFVFKFYTDKKQYFRDEYTLLKQEDTL